MIDREITIAVGKNRKEINWKNVKTTWEDFVARVSKTQRTEETQRQYMTAKKDYQDTKKDVGGFVGGYLSGGRRKSEAVVYRSLITLDMDQGSKEAWEEWKMLYGWAGVAYSTHKHSPEKPRLRIVVPLDRDCTREEYEPLSRSVAQKIGIDCFDTTTYEAARLMYWPSTSKDAEFYLDECKGDFISVDKVLAEYSNWHDCSEWPMAQSEDRVISHAIGVQQDPCEKEGFVGAFCCTYGIEEAISKYLSQEYESTSKENRYTYKKGSTTAGLVVYEDKWAYSHHATDPAGNKLCNSFDLVRLHLYAQRDESVAENTPVNKRPSYTAMLDLIRKDKKVMLTLSRKRVQSVQEDFADLGGTKKQEQEHDKGSDEWLSDLERDKKGEVKSTIANCLRVLKNDPQVKDKLYFNSFRYLREVRGRLPWRKEDESSGEWSDADQSNLTNFMEAKYGISSRAVIENALNIVFEEHKYHPVKDYLLSLEEWDKEERIERLLPEFFGADDNPYTRQAMRKALTACVKRVFEPGCKFDYVLTLVGEEGCGKSTIFYRLGKEWFSDNMLSVTGKESKEQLQGVWIMEISELAALRKAEVEAIKQYISCREDRYRPAYGHNSVSFARQCVFFGTTNNAEFLKGATGNRRFWPVQTHPERSTKKVHEDFTKELRDKVWAEALHYYREGEELWLGDELELQAKEQQEAHTEADPWEEIINRFIECKWPKDWAKWDATRRRDYFMYPDSLQAKGEVQRDKFTVMMIWQEAMGGVTAGLGEKEKTRIKNILCRRKDVKEALVRADKNVTRGFIKISNMEDLF